MTKQSNKSNLLTHAQLSNRFKLLSLRANKLSDKMDKLKVPATQRTRVIRKLMVINSPIKRNVFGKIINLKVESKTKPNLAKLNPNLSGYLSWRKRRIQRKKRRAVYRSRKSDRFLKWYARRNEKRWKRSIDRRFVRSYMIVQPNYDMKFSTTRRHLAKAHSKVGLYVDAVRLTPSSVGSRLIAGSNLTKLGALSQSHIDAKAFGVLLLRKCRVTNAILTPTSVNKAELHSSALAELSHAFTPTAGVNTPKSAELFAQRMSNLNPLSWHPLTTKTRLTLKSRVKPGVFKCSYTNFSGDHDSKISTGTGFVLVEDTKPSGPKCWCGVTLNESKKRCPDRFGSNAYKRCGVKKPNEAGSPAKQALAFAVGALLTYIAAKIIRSYK